MGVFKAAAVQMRSGESPERNAVDLERLVREAAGQGATYIQTPEMTGALIRDKEARAASFTSEDKDIIVATARRLAERTRRLPAYRLDRHPARRRQARQPGAAVRPGRRHARHLRQDPHVRRRSRQWRELARIRRLRAGHRGRRRPRCRGAKLGFAVCYDLRFPQLFRAEALAGADVFSVPAAFTRQTGEAHWHVLLRARAIENGAYVVAAAQGGLHEDGRETYGHSLIVDPWGRIIAEAAHDEPAVIVAEIDPAQSLAARKKIPNLKNARDFAVNAGAGEAPRLRGAAS